MGNQSVKDPNSWEVVAKNDFSTVKRNSRGQHIEEYKHVLQTQADLKLFVERSQTRKYNFTDKPQLNVVELLDFKYNQLKLMCSMSYEGVSVIERIPTRLSEVGSLPEEKMIYVLSEVLNGYQSLSSFYGNEFDIQSKMIGLNQQNTVKVWHNSNFSKLDPEFELLGSAYAKVNHENRMISRIFQICQSLTEKQQFSPNFKFKRDTSLKKPYSFEGAKSFLTQFGEEFYPSLMQDFEPDRKLVKENVLQNGQVTLKEHKLNQPPVKKSSPPTLTSIPSKYQRFLKSESNKTLPLATEKPPQHNLSLNYYSPINFEEENNNHQQSVLSLKSYNMHTSFRPADSPQGPPKRTERVEQFQRPIVSEPQIFSKESYGRGILIEQLPLENRPREAPMSLQLGPNYNTAVSPSSQPPHFPQLPIRSSQNYQTKSSHPEVFVSQLKPSQSRPFQPVVTTHQPSELVATPIYQLPQFNPPTPKTSPFPISYTTVPSVNRVIQQGPPNPNPSMSPSPASELLYRKAPVVESHIERPAQIKIQRQNKMSFDASVRREQPVQPAQNIHTVKAMTLPTLRINPIKSDVRVQIRSENQKPPEATFPKFQQPLLLPSHQTQNRADSLAIHSKQTKSDFQNQARAGGLVQASGSQNIVRVFQSSQKVSQGLSFLTPLNSQNQKEQSLRTGGKQPVRPVIMDEFVPRDVFRIDLNVAK